MSHFDLTPPFPYSCIIDAAPGMPRRLTGIICDGAATLKHAHTGEGGGSGGGGGGDDGGGGGSGGGGGGGGGGGDGGGVGTCLRPGRSVLWYAFRTPTGRPLPSFVTNGGKMEPVFPYLSADRECAFELR